LKATRRGSIAARVRVAVLAAVLVAWSALPVAASGPYRMGPQDKVRVIVSEWSSAGGEARTRLTGEFTVDVAGLLSLPLIGEVEAAGRTTAEVGQAVSARMQARAGLVNPPVTSVEVVQYRPFYVLGFVANPGEHPYRPGLTVLQARTTSTAPPCRPRARARPSPRT